MSSHSAHIEPVRDASRRLVRVLGFMRGTLAGTDLSPSAVHALIELGAHGTLRAVALAETLHLEKSSVSRLVRKLVDAGLVSEKTAPGDGRAKMLSLTKNGKTTLAGIHGFARRQVADALKRLPPPDYGTILRGLRLYADALAGVDVAAAPFTLETGYAPALLARCTELHADYYARHHGFGRAFEARVAQGLADFSGRMDHACNRFWRIEQDGRIQGTIAIDGEDLGAGAAHLRWFIVDESLRGAGAGRQLLTAALAFCDARGFKETRLWTFRGLDAARRLYEANGFRLVTESPGSQWGTEVVEQQFTRG